jgi:hypothetical protein
MQVVHCRRKDKMSDDLCIISAIKHAKVMSDCKKMCEIYGANHFLSATQCFEDDVYSQTSTLAHERTVFAPDIMYPGCLLAENHRGCSENWSTEDNHAITAAFQKLLKKFSSPQRYNSVICVHM